MPSRRTFIAAGLVGAAALATAAWLRGPHSPALRDARSALDADGDAIVRAIIPALLDGALPQTAKIRSHSIDATLDGVDRAVAGLPRAARAELHQLFALLALPPVRRAVAGISSPWPEASVADVAAFLERLRTSRSTLLRSAYDAMHQLVFAAWYGNPDSWQRIGYPGPPPLSS